MQKSKWTLATLALMATLGGAMVGCAPKSNTATPAAPTAVTAPANQTAAVNNPPHFTLGYSVYVGWEPWYYAAQEGILKKWADKEGIVIDVVPMEYGASIGDYSAGKLDALAITNMDCLIAPAAAGMKSTVVIVGDYSNGNDAILTRNGLTLADMGGKRVAIVPGTVSQYLWSRGLEMANMQDTATLDSYKSDSDIANAALSSKTMQVAVTWNPSVMRIENDKTAGFTRVFDSSKIPGEIQDLCIANTKVLNAHPEFGRALAGSWYEVMGIMSQRGDTSEAALDEMAKLTPCSAEDFRNQLKTTAMFYSPKSAVDFTDSQELQVHNEMVRTFCFKAQLMGEKAKSADDIGISYPDGTVQGSKDNVEIQYDDTYMKQAADGKL